MRTLTKFICISIGLLLPVVALAKGDGVGFWMEGTVTNITVTGESIHFQLTGRFWFSQYPGGGTNESVIVVDCKQGASATISQAKPSFFAMTPSWNGGAIQEEAALLRILKAAAEHGRTVKLELMTPKLTFRPFTILDAEVIRATDADLLH